ncbi:MAG: hypothetical protein DU489_07090 [Nitrosomonas sp.]|uniref:HK97 family phage prohead protease n=1 Tax=Nitrosomonas sp. TaxID=42353 RepID=UPI0032F06318
MKKLSNDLAIKINKWIDSEEIKSLIEATKKSADEDSGTFEVVITTENVDRYREVVSQAGLDTTHYLNNPVVLWGHDHNIIIGVTTSLTKREDGNTVARGKFAPTEEAQEKRRLYDQGFLFASSIGFIEKEREGNLITKSELLEWSFVSVPANPYALSLAMEKQLNINDLVTKGIFTLKEIEEIVEEAKPIETPTEEPTEITLTDEQKALADLITKQVITAIKDGALETTASESERTEDEPVEDVEEDPAVKEFEQRKKLQQADTLIGEVLADLRQKYVRHS